MAVLAAMAAVGAVFLTGGISSLFYDPVRTAVPRSRSPAQAPRLPVAPTTALREAPGPAPSPAPVSARASVGWEVQLGAFVRPGAAEGHLRGLAERLPEVAGATVIPPAAGSLTRLRIVRLADEGAARSLCARIQQANAQCFVVRPD